MFKKILLGIGIITILLGTLLGGFIVFTTSNTDALKTRALPYIAKAIPEISKWNLETMTKYMDPEVQSKISNKQLIEIINAYSKMGKFISMDKPKFQTVKSGVSTKNGDYVIINYLVPVKYENGDANIAISLIDKETTFNVYLFRLNSNALFQ